MLLKTDVKGENRMDNRKENKTKVQDVCSAIGCTTSSWQTITAYSQMYDVAKRIELKSNGIQCEEADYEK